MNYSQAVKFLESRQKFGINLGLCRVWKLLSYLNDPQDKFRSILVAGTNGKGSVCAMLSSVLTRAGYRTGLYTSPHLISWLERIRINDIDVGRQKFARSVNRVRLAIKSHGRLIGELTLFEVITAAAFLVFADSGVDVAVVEVGMGGRLDATNVLDPLVCAITNVDLDHTDILGKTVKAIAKEKAGIVKAGVPVVTAAKGDALRAIKCVCKKMNAPLYQVNGGGKIPSPLPGKHQRSNLGVALKVLEMLEKAQIKITSHQIRSGLRRTRWVGRFQAVSRRPLFILDGAHNPAGARALSQAIRQNKVKRPVTLILGILKTKDYRGIVRELAPVSQRIIATMSSHPDSLPYRLIEKEAKKHLGEVISSPNVSGAIKTALSFGRDQSIVVAGSLFTVADAIKCH